MKKKTRFVLLIVGIILIVFGAMMPTMFAKSKEKYDKLTFHNDMASGVYSCKITITSVNSYTINKAVVYLEDFFGDQGITKEVSSAKITKTQSQNGYVYAFTISYASFGEYSKFSKVKEVKLNTTDGTKIAKEESDSFGISWTTPVMIIFIFLGSMMVLGSVIMIVSPKIKKSAANMIRQRVKNADSSIRVEYMTDDNVLSKYESYLKEKAKLLGIDLDSVDESGEKINSIRDIELTNDDFIKMFGGQIESEMTHRTCAYCGSENDLNSKKCSSCGASLKSKR